MSVDKPNTDNWDSTPYHKPFLQFYKLVKSELRKIFKKMLFGIFCTPTLLGFCGFGLYPNLHALLPEKPLCSASCHPKFLRKSL